MQFEPQHDKTNKVSVRPAKTQISLGIHPVWSESSLCAQWVAKNPRTVNTLIRLGGCPDWSESLLGAHSFCWFCHVAAHFCLTLNLKKYRACTAWNIGIKHDFLCINFCWAPREGLKIYKIILSCMNAKKHWRFWLTLAIMPRNVTLSVYILKMPLLE